MKELIVGVLTNVEFSSTVEKNERVFGWPVSFLRGFKRFCT